MMTDSEFLDAVETFLRDTKMAPTAFGLQAHKDPTFISKLRRGRSVSLKIANRTVEFMDKHRREIAA